MKNLFILIGLFIVMGLSAQVTIFDKDTVRNSVAIRTLITNDGILVDSVEALRTDIGSSSVDATARAMLQDSLGLYNAVSYGGINEALAGLPSTGGVVYVPEGVYSITEDVTRAIDNVTIRGMGDSLSIIYLASGSNDNLITVGGDNWTIENIGFNGNRENNTGTCYGIYSSSRDGLVIDNVTIDSCEDAAIYLRNQCIDVEILNSTIRNGSGIYGYSAAGQSGSKNVNITNCGFYNINAGSQIATGGDGERHDGWSVSKSRFKGTTGYMGVIFSKSDNMAVADSYFELDSAYGASNPACIRYADSTSGVIIGNQILGAGGSTEGHAGISLLSTSNISITGNYITNTNGSRGNGIQIEAQTNNYDTENIVISGNTFYNISTTDSRDAIVLYAASGYTLERINISDNVFMDDREGDAVCSYAVSFSGSTVGTVKDIIIDGNIANGLANAFVIVQASGDNVSITNNHVSDMFRGVIMDDGDDAKISGNTFRDISIYPYDVSNAAVVRPMITNNNWYGATNDGTHTSATTPRVSMNIDKDGAWFAGDGPD